MGIHLKQSSLKRYQRSIVLIFIFLLLVILAFRYQSRFHVQIRFISQPAGTP
jgi:hypothetical protein